MYYLKYCTWHVLGFFILTQSKHCVIMAAKTFDTAFCFHSVQNIMSSKGLLHLQNHFNLFLYSYANSVCSFSWQSSLRFLILVSNLKNVIPGYPHHWFHRQNSAPGTTCSLSSKARYCCSAALLPVNIASASKMFTAHEVWHDHFMHLGKIDFKWWQPSQSSSLLATGKH